MNIQEYIESGIIESYVLGLANAEEAAELEMLCQHHPEVKNALEAFEAQIETQAVNNAVAPPPGVKGRIMEILKDEFAKDEEDEKLIAPVIPISDEIATPVRSVSFWKYLAAASVILLIGSAALNLYFYNSYTDATAQYEALLSERNLLQADNDVFRTRLNDFENSLRITQNPDFLKVNMPATPKKPGNLAAVYWNQKTKEVYLLPTQLNNVPQDKQYQLWAIVKGQPISIGLLDECNGICPMNFKVTDVQAFAITLENKGGSAAPTLDEMYVYGEVKI